MSKHSITINSIYCNGTSESGHDEVYLVLQADASHEIRFPAKPSDANSMESGDTWDLEGGITLNFEYEVLVTLWDQDLSFDPNLATYLQSKDFQPGSGSGSVNLTNRNGANYTIHYTYID